MRHGQGKNKSETAYLQRWFKVYQYDEIQMWCIFLNSNNSIDWQNETAKVSEFVTPILLNL